MKSGLRSLNLHQAGGRGGIKDATRIIYLYIYMTGPSSDDDDWKITFISTGRRLSVGRTRTTFEFPVVRCPETGDDRKIVRDVRTCDNRLVIDFTVAALQYCGYFGAWDYCTPLHPPPPRRDRFIRERVVTRNTGPPVVNRRRFIYFVAFSFFFF